MIRLGTGIALIVVGLILALAVNFTFSGINIQWIGWILVLTGIVAVVLYFLQPRRPVVAPVAREAVVERPVERPVEERRREV